MTPPTKVRKSSQKVKVVKARLRKRTGTSKLKVHPQKVKTREKTKKDKSKVPTEKATRLVTTLTTTRTIPRKREKREPLSRVREKPKVLRWLKVQRTSRTLQRL